MKTADLGTPTWCRRRPTDTSAPGQVPGADQSGVSLIELIVALFVLGIVLAGTAAGVVAALSLTRDSRAVTVASGLATAGIEDALAAPFTSVEGEVAIPRTPGVETIDGTGYTITRTVAWVDSLTTTGACAGVAQAGDDDVLLVDVSVDWEGRRISGPVSQQTTLSPPVGLYDPNTATMVIEVTDAQQPAQPVRDVSVSVRGPIGGTATTRTALTSADGCAVFQDVPPGDYQVTVDKLGHVTPAQERAPAVSKTVGVGIGGRTASAFQYAPEEFLRLGVVGRDGGQVPPGGLTAFVATNAATHDVGAITGTATPTTVGLWPEAYQTWVGGCVPADPEAVDGGALVWPDGDRGPAVRTSPPPGGSTHPIVAGSLTATWGIGWVPGETLELVAVSRDTCSDPAEERIVLGSATAGTPATFVLPWGSWDLVAQDSFGVEVGQGALPGTLDPSVPGAVAVELTRTAPTVRARSCAAATTVRPGSDEVARPLDLDGRFSLQVPAATEEGDLVVVTALGHGASRWLASDGWDLDTVAADDGTELAVWTRTAPAGLGGEAIDFVLVRDDLPHVAQVFTVAGPATVREAGGTVDGTPGVGLSLPGLAVVRADTLELVVTGAAGADGGLTTMAGTPGFETSVVDSGVGGTHLLTSDATLASPLSAPSRELSWDAVTDARLAIAMTIEGPCS